MTATTKNGPAQGTILVTGATGTIGSEVVKWLSSINVPVKAIVRSEEKADSIRAPSVTLATLDYHNTPAYDAVFEGVEKIFLLTPFSEEMVRITEALVNAARKAGVKHIVKLSAIGAAPDVSVKMLQWHHQAEEIIKDSGIPYTILQPNMFMQNFLNFFSQSIKENDRFAAPVGNAKGSFIDARDIAAVAGVVLTKPGHEGKTYVLTGSQAISYVEAAEIMTKILKREIIFSPSTDEEALSFMKSANMPDWMSGAMTELYGAFKAGKMAAVSNCVKDIAGKQPILFEQFIKEHAAAFTKPVPAEE